jgi:RNA-directed DNA polymerase
MGSLAKRHRNLIGRIVAPQTMALAYQRTAKAKRQTTGYLEFKEYAELNLARLANDMADGSYRPGPIRHFTIFEPKERLISAIPFRDRVAQHALVAVIGPIFEAAFLPRTFACRDGLGTHAGIKLLQADMRRLGAPLYFLKTDFSKYFASIDRAVLHEAIERKIGCGATLDLIRAITPTTGTGLPIGSLTSQLYANVYGGTVDRLLQCGLKVRHWYRYMDDVVVLDRDSGRLRDIKERIVALAGDRLKLRLSRWGIASVTRGVNFLGYRVWPSHKLLRRQSVIHARRAIRAMRAAGKVDELRRFLAAWIGHARWADVEHLLHSLHVIEAEAC